MSYVTVVPFVRTTVTYSTINRVLPERIFIINLIQKNLSLNYNHKTVRNPELLLYLNIHHIEKRALAASYK